MMFRLQFRSKPDNLETVAFNTQSLTLGLLRSPVGRRINEADDSQQG